jgi:DNA-binding NarL/FixJ family response regulator
VRVLIVEDHELLAQSLAVALEGQGIAADVARGATPDDLLDFVKQRSVDLVLLDLDLGAWMGSGVELVPELVGRGARVAILTGSTDRTRHAEAVEAGAVGVLEKSTSFDNLVEAVREAARGNDLLSRHERSELLKDLHDARVADADRHAVFDRLTPRERQVLGGLMDGRSADEMAARWVVSLATVRSQIRSVLMKLGVHSQLAAVALARQRGWTMDRTR